MTRIRPILLALVALTMLTSPILTQPQTVSALSASDWKAGNIIDDGPFENASAMSVAQIQNWLNIRLQNCDYYGTKPSELSGGIDYDGNGTVTRAEYGRTMGNPAPFTCLNNYYEVPKTTPGSTIPANNYGSSTIPSGAKSAAQLIYDAAQAYNISPKVLLVKLGTESAGPLTSDPWPFERQYTYAMGAHCPDSGPGGSANCDTDYAGFSLQIREAARLLRWYLDSMTQSWWTYKVPYATNYILWNVSETGCSGSNVYIQNKATAALYTYTPYQPNQASLDAYPGTGNSCSSYGNRNFWYVYNIWFGSSHLPEVFRTSTSVRTYLLSGSSYFYIPSPELLAAYGYTSGDVGVVGSSDIDALTYGGVLQRTARFGGDEIYLIDRGKKFHFSSSSMLNAYGYSIGDETSLDTNLSYALPDGGTVTSIVNEVETNVKYFIENTSKRHISGPSAYTTLGSPIYSTIPTTNLSEAYVQTLPDGAPIVPPNTFVKDSNGSIAGFWDGAALTPVANEIYGQLKPKMYTGTRVSLMPTSGSTLTELINTDSSNFYILDSEKAYHLTDAQLSYIGLTPSDFTQVDQALITKLSGMSMLREFRPITRINGSDAIYLLENGTRRYVTSRRALSDYGFTIGDAININSRTASHLTSSPNVVFGTGTLLRIDGGNRIYVINSKTSKVHISSPSMLQSYGYSFGQVRNIASTALGGYPTSGVLSNLVRSTVSPTNVWVIDRAGIRRLINAADNSAAGYNIDSTSLIVLDNNLLTLFDQQDDLTTVVRAENTAPVYIIKDGQKHWVTSRNALYREGFSFGDVSAVSQTTLNEIPSGDNIN